MAGFALFITMSANHGAADCRVTDEDFIKRQLPTMKDWQNIYSVFKKNIPQCPDDGVFAEGYDAVVVKTLAKRWSDLPQLKTLASEDTVFRSFVYKHISATTDRHDLQHVLHNANANCPPNCSKLCSDIAGRAKLLLAGKQ